MSDRSGPTERTHLDAAGLAALRKDFGAPPEWVFGYGSLMWRPGFPYVESRTAVLHGRHRAPCVLSRRHRGTAAMPGVVLGLDAGGACRGVAFRIAAADAVDVLDYLFERELGGYGVYRPARCTVRLQEPSGTPRVSALCFVVDRSHEQYVGDWSLDDLVTLVRQGQGEGGRCIDYYADALAKLEMLGIKDRTVRRLYAAAG